LAYVPKWSLVDALTRGMALGHTRSKVKRDICAALLSDIRFLATPDDNVGLPRYHLVSFEVPRDLTPKDLDWANSRPEKPWVSTYGHPAAIAKLELFADDVNHALGWDASQSSSAEVTSAKEKGAIKALASLLKSDPDKKRDDAQAWCVSQGYVLSNRGFQQRVWPMARKHAGLLPLATAGRKKKSLGSAKRLSRPPKSGS
jgi:hypothetical protein